MNRRPRLVPRALLLLTALTVAACGTPGQGPTATNTDVGGTTDPGQSSSPTVTQTVSELTVFQNANSGTPLGNLQREVYAAFEKKTGIKVNISDVPADNFVQAYEAAVAAGTEGDLVITNPTTDKYGWIRNGAISDMTPYLSEWGLKDSLLDGALDGWSDTDGKLLGIPYYGFVWPMLWNTDVLKAAGVDSVPQTKEELLAAAAAVNAKGGTLLSVAGGDWPGAAFFLQVIQGRTDNDTMAKVFKEGGYCGTESVKAAIQDFVDMRDGGVFVKSAEGYTMDQQNTLFFNGEAAALHGATWWFNDVPEEMRPAVEVGGIPGPGEGVHPRPLAVRASNSGGFWISPNGTKKSEAVGELVSMFYEEEWAQKLVSDVGQVPNMKIKEIPATKNSIYGQVVSPEFGDKVSWIILPDSLIPGDIKSPVEEAQPYQPGTSADAICSAMDSVYS